jgi:two-component system chemotaxis response regulator CheB
MNEQKIKVATIASIQCQIAPSHVVAIGTSTGGVRALCQLLSALPPDFPAPILIVLHLSPNYPSQLAEILNRYTPLAVMQAVHGERLCHGTVYIAPPDRHLMVNADRTLVLSAAARVNWTRPAVDVLFQSIAAHFRNRAIGVVLTGYHRDGAAGAQVIKRMGGRILVQDRKTAQVFDMPQATIRTGSVDFVLPLWVMAPALIALTMAPGAAELLRVSTPAPASLIG